MKNMYLWLRVDDNVTQKDILKNLSENGVTYGIHPLPDFDWFSFRREAAKEILPAIINWRRMNGAGANILISKEEATKLAIEYADELIRQLKQE